MTVDYLKVAKDITLAHERLLHAIEEPDVAAVLIEAGRCPSCAGPLLKGDRVARCASCGHEVHR